MVFVAPPFGAAGAGQKPGATRGTGHGASGQQSLLRPHAYFVKMPQQVGRILIDPVRSRALQLILTVAAGKQTHSQGSAAASRKQIPDAIAHDNGIGNRYAQAFGGGEEEIRVRFGAGNLITCNHGSTALQSQ